MEIPKLLFPDTNILFPILRNPKGGMARLYMEVLAPNYTLVTSQYVLDELKDAIFSDLRHQAARKAWKRFSKVILPEILIVNTPTQEHLWEELLDDTKDAPILRAALSVNADILAEDHDFLRIRDDIEEIRIININELLEEIENN